MPLCALCNSTRYYVLKIKLHGTLIADEQLAREDFIIHRRDGLFAYNLAVVVDDNYQGVSKLCVAQI